MRLQSGLAWVIVGMALAFSACSSAGAVDGPVFTSPRPSLFGEGGMDAVVSGTLEFDGECLYLVSGGVASPVVWPFGASWETDPPAVAFGDRQIAPGTYVSGTGGHIPLTFDVIQRAAGAAVAEAASRCAGPTGEIAYFNVGSSVEVGSG